MTVSITRSKIENAVYRFEDAYRSTLDDYAGDGTIDIKSDARDEAIAALQNWVRDELDVMFPRAEAATIVDAYIKSDGDMEAACSLLALTLIDMEVVLRIVPDSKEYFFAVTKTGKYAHVHYAGDERSKGSWSSRSSVQYKQSLCGKYLNEPVLRKGVRKPSETVFAETMTGIDKPLCSDCAERMQRRALGSNAGVLLESKKTYTCSERPDIVIKRKIDAIDERIASCKNTVETSTAAWAVENANNLLVTLGAEKRDLMSNYSVARSLWDETYDTADESIMCEYCGEATEDACKCMRELDFTAWTDADLDTLSVESLMDAVAAERARRVQAQINALKRTRKGLEDHLAEQQRNLNAVERMLTNESSAAMRNAKLIAINGAMIALNTAIINIDAQLAELMTSSKFVTPA